MKDTAEVLVSLVDADSAPRAAKDEIVLLESITQSGATLPCMGVVQLGPHDYPVWVRDGTKSSAPLAADSNRQLAIDPPDEEREADVVHRSMAVVGPGPFARALAQRPTTEIELRIPLPLHAKTVMAPAGAVPSGAEVILTTGASASLGQNYRQGWYLLVADGRASPVRARMVARSRSNELGRHARRAVVRVGLLVRILTGCRQRSTVALIPTPNVRLRHRWWMLGARVRLPAAYQPAPWLRWSLLPVAGLVVYLGRSARWAAEHTARLALRAPRYAFKAMEGHPGDDSRDIVRIHPAAFPLLGIPVGAQVALTWFGRTTLVRALEDFDLSQSENELLLKALETAGTVQPLSAEPEGLPGYLQVRIGSQVRDQLGMPPRSVVEMRRSVMSLIAAHLAELTLPLFGTLFAAAALESIPYRWQLTAAVGVLGIVFGLTPLRLPREPMGPFP